MHPDDCTDGRVKPSRGAGLLRICVADAGTTLRKHVAAVLLHAKTGQQLQTFCCWAANPDHTVRGCP